MPKRLYKIYAGLNGSFGGAIFQGVYEFASQKEADKFAYDLAVEEYESYGGNHGLLDWDGVYEDLLESEWIEPGAQSEAEIEGIVDDAYIEQMEGWLEYKAVPIPFGRMCDSDCDEDDAYDDDDAECYTDD